MTKRLLKVRRRIRSHRANLHFKKLKFQGIIGFFRRNEDGTTTILDPMEIKGKLSGRSWTPVDMRPSNTKAEVNYLNTIETLKVFAK